MIERPPYISHEQIVEALFNNAKKPNSELQSLIEKINDGYEYWDTVKYKQCPKDITSRKLWASVKASRLINTIRVWNKFNVTLGITNKMQRLCHEFDMNFGGPWGSKSVISSENRSQYLISSLMEEAIFSSQMEGAATTRKIAKDMLRKKMTPRDKSQQMITNNFQTIQFIVEHKDEPLTTELLLKIHQLMTNDTMDNPDDSGRFRESNNVVVENGITHETVHTPPSYNKIPEFVNDLCFFFNEEKSKIFIHPIIRGIIVHFMIAYIHPFVDGNGRTARAMFYWYMLKQGYWLTEYMSISRVIAKSKKSYEKVFLYTEADSMDIGYFVNYNLNVLEKSFNQLQNYIKRKQREKSDAKTFLQLGNINERQAQILKMYHDDSSLVLTIKDLQAEFLISPTTAKSDLTLLLSRGVISQISFNKIKKGYIKGNNFDSTIDKLKAVSK